MNSIKIEIKSWITGNVIFSLEKEENSIKITLEAAVKSGANLGGANLVDANLGGANLLGANLGDANLGGANLKDANLRGASLWDANLRGANLRGANLGGANLGGANLKGASLWGARGNNVEIKSLHASKYDVSWSDTIVQIGCKRYEKERWLSFTDDEISAMENGALEWWNKWKDKLIVLGVFYSGEQ